MLKELLLRDRLQDETRLCNLLIRTVEWSSPYISAGNASELFKMIVSQPDLCIEGVNAMASFALSTNERVDWNASELTLMLESASTNFDKYLTADSVIRVNHDPDWLQIGINHPAGKYLQMIAKLDVVYYEESKAHSEVAKKLIEDLGLDSLKESNGSKALIACFFESLNVWTALDKNYAQAVVSNLAADDWTAVPAWQGMAGLRSVSTATWEITKNQWKNLFAGDIPVGGKTLDTLVRLYVWIAIVHADDEQKIRMLEACGSWSKSTFEAASHQITNWMHTISSEERNVAWNNWLSISFKFIASAIASDRAVLASTYSNWVRRYPDLRQVIVRAMMRDCSDIEDKTLLVHDGVLTDIAQDSGLAPSDASFLITFLLNHQRYFVNEDDARTAAKYIDFEALPDNMREELRDAYTRKGMSDIDYGVGQLNPSKGGK